MQNLVEVVGTISDNWCMQNLFHRELSLRLLNLEHVVYSKSWFESEIPVSLYSRLPVLQYMVL